jgi:hypothetical protein
MSSTAQLGRGSVLDGCSSTPFRLPPSRVPRRSASQPLPAGGALSPRSEPVDISIVQPSSSSYQSAAGLMSGHLHAPPATLSLPAPSPSNFSIRPRGQRTKKTSAPRDAVRVRCSFVRRIHRMLLLPVINRIHAVPPGRQSLPSPAASAAVRGMIEGGPNVLSDSLEVI